MTEDQRDEKPRYYDVEKFQRVYYETLKPRGRVGRFVNRVFSFLDSVQGFFIALMGLPIMFGVLGAVIVGAYYGPWAFIGIMGSVIGGLTLFVERKAGRSLQFSEYHFLRRTLATVIAFSLALGLIYFLVFLSRFRLF